MIDSYGNAVKVLTSQGKFYINLGLERVREVLGLFNNPHLGLKVVHVAGTNGKGSVCAILASILKSAGYKVGLYTSPHLFEYTERIKISGKDISKNEFSEYVSSTCKVADQHGIHLTEFEILTVSAYRYFFDNNVDVAVIETGLGGRLDATNVVENNLCSIITSISIDHKDRLGDTVDKIAFEKAGIIKNSCPVIVSNDNKGYGVIKETAEQLKSNVVVPTINVSLKFENTTNYAIINGEKFEFALLGLWQKSNLELVFTALGLLKENNSFVINNNDVAAGLRTVNWPARMQFVKERNLLIDGAHNADGAEQLRKSLDYYFPDLNRIWIYGSLNTKEYGKVAATLFRKTDKVYFYHFQNKNAVTAEELLRNVTIDLSNISLSKAANILNNFDKKCLTIVSGSFYMIGEIFTTHKL